MSAPPACRYSVRVLQDIVAHFKPLVAAANRGAHGAKKRYLLAAVHPVRRRRPAAPVIICSLMSHQSLCLNLHEQKSHCALLNQLFASLCGQGSSSCRVLS